MESLVRPVGGCNRPSGCASVRVDMDHVGDRALLAFGDIAERDQRLAGGHSPVGEGFPGVRDSSSGFECPDSGEASVADVELVVRTSDDDLATSPPVAAGFAAYAEDEFCDSAVRSKIAKRVAPTRTTQVTTAIRMRRRRRARCLASSISASTSASTSWRSTGSLGRGGAVTVMATSLGTIELLLIALC